MEPKLENNLALVTGSTAGIGYATAEALLREGARVVINGRTQAAVDEACASLRESTAGQSEQRSGGGAPGPARVMGYAADLSSASAVEGLVRAHPDVDILVNNLGIFEAKPFEEVPDADWIRMFEVNVLSGVRLSRAYIPGMRRRDWGRIIFVSSESALQIPAEMIHYGMTKAAQIAVARGLAESLAGTRITVNSVLAGPTRSRGVDDFVESMTRAGGKSFAEVEQEFFQRVRPTSLLKRFLTTAEVASMIAYIASPAASGTTGSALRVDGGVVKSAF